MLIKCERNVALEIDQNTVDIEKKKLWNNWVWIKFIWALNLFSFMTITFEEIGAGLSELKLNEYFCPNSVYFYQFHLVMSI